MDGFIWNQGGLPPFKRSAVKKETHPPAAGGNFTRLRFATPWQASVMERQRNETTSQARLLEFGEDVKKRLRLLSEVALRAEK